MTPIIITQAAIKPAIVKTTIMAVNIFPRRFMSDIPATADEMEKKTRGMTIVKRRLRNISPSGLRTAASFLEDDSKNRADNNGYNQNERETVGFKESR